jgi:RNA polymerase sigma factor (sigma-70 family)
MCIHQQDDQVLVSNYISGDNKCLEELLLRHKRSIFGHIQSYINDRKIAEDIFQDTFYKVIVTLKSGAYNEEGKFLPWVMRIAHNKVMDHFRAKKKMPTVSTNVQNDDGESIDLFDILKSNHVEAEDVKIKLQEKKRVRELIQLLPMEQREVLMMRMYYDMSFKEISDQTGSPVNTALGRMRYALINLKRLMDQKSMVNA